MTRRAAVLAVVLSACSPAGSGGVGGGSGGSGGAGGGGISVPAPKRATLARFSRGNRDTYIDDQGRYFSRFSPISGWLHVDPGPVESGFSSDGSLSCVLRLPDRKPACWMLTSSGTDPGRPHTKRLITMVNGSAMKDVTDYAFGLIPASGTEQNVFCAVQEGLGLSCFSAAVEPGWVPLWMSRIEVQNVKRIVRLSPTAMIVVKKNGRMRRCSLPSPPAPQIVSCVEGPASLPNAVLEDAAGDLDDGIGITTTGELVQWGFPGAQPPPAGTFKRFVGDRGDNGQIGFGAYGCAISTTDHLACWGLGPSGAPPPFPNITEPVRDVAIDTAYSLFVIDMNGELRLRPDGGIPNVPTYGVALDACPLMGATPAVCSEITDYKSEETATPATPADYKLLCEEDDGVPKLGESCQASRPSRDILYWCPGQTFNIKGKPVEGNGYFYKNFGSCQTARTACQNATTGTPPGCPIAQ